MVMLGQHEHDDTRCTYLLNLLLIYAIFVSCSINDGSWLFDKLAISNHGLGTDVGNGGRAGLVLHERPAVDKRP